MDSPLGLQSLEALIVIVVIVALESELSRQTLPRGIELLHAGVGKVNAAIATCRALHAHRPELIVNYGTAGAISDAARGLVEVGRVIQRDMLAVPLAPRGVTPFDPDAAEIVNGRPGLCCGSGDSFVTASDPWLLQQGVDLVDMELFAIARACARAQVPWRAFKFVTDEAGAAAADDWQARVGDGESLFLSALESLRGLPGGVH
jgi:adenosylhomocysteine nucleosidase